MTLLIDDTEVTDASVVPYTKLAIAVLKQAVEDATYDPPPPARTLKYYDDECRKYRQHLQDRDEARTFLTTLNVPLQAWCRMAGLNVHTVLHYSKGAATDWAEMGRRFSLHQYRVNQEYMSDAMLGNQNGKRKKDDPCPPDVNQ